METDESKRGIRKFLLKRMLFVPLGIVALAATSYARQHPDWAEHVYAQGVYPALSNVVGFLPSLVSFSVAEDVYKRQSRALSLCARGAGCATVRCAESRVREDARPHNAQMTLFANIRQVP